MTDGSAPGFRRDLVRSLRPWQWVKNGVVLLPLFFGSHRADPRAILATALAVLAFCALSSAVYLVNDVTDRREDALHPIRRWRPIAAGRISIRVASIAAGIAFAVGCAVLAGVEALGGDGTLLFGVLYLALQALYVSLLKPRPWLGALAIAGGFVLRAEAGGAASSVEVSHWLVICTFLGAFGVALGKRATDARLLGKSERESRSLERGTDVLLAAFVLAFALYTVAPRTVHEFGTHGFALAIPLAGYGAYRFHHLVLSTDRALDPARAFVADRRLALTVFGFVLLMLGVLLARPQTLP